MVRKHKLVSDGWGVGSGKGEEVNGVGVRGAVIERGRSKNMKLDGLRRWGWIEEELGKGRK